MSLMPDAATPLYERVKNHILTNIGSGAWSGDRRIPSENELVAELGISRMTVNRALRELTAAGVLVRVQGVGTFVAAPRPQIDLLEINNIAEEIAGRGNRHRSEVLTLERVATTRELRLAFEAANLETAFHSVVVHYENDIAVQLEERFVNPGVVPNYGAQDFRRQTTYDYLVAITPITELEHIISAVAADQRTAQLLNISEGDPCLLLDRRTWTGSEVVTVNKLSYVGAHYSFRTRTQANRSSSRYP